MQRGMVLVLGGILLFSCAIVRAQEGQSVRAKTENGDLGSAASDCSSYVNARLEARRILERDRRALEMPAEFSSLQQINNSSPQRIDLLQDLKTLDQSESAVIQCTFGRDALSDTPEVLRSCSSEQILNFQMNHEGDQEREVPILRIPGNIAFFYEAGMTIDADGAPNAYHPDNTGLDDLANAGSPGHWEGLAKNETGEPFVQGPDDPFPGYYVSATALTDRTKSLNDPSRYVDAGKIPYIVLPGAMAREIGMRPGDFAVVLNPRNGQSSYAIFGDVGPFDRIGEGSIALAKNLGIHADARNGGARRGVVYLIFPGSGDGRPKTIEEINAGADRLLQAWGGIDLLSSCMRSEPARQIAGSSGTN